MMEYYSTKIIKNKVVTYTITTKKPENMMLSERSWIRKPTVYGPVNMKCVEQANPQRQKVNQWLAGAWEKEGRTVRPMVMQFPLE